MTKQNDNSKENAMNEENAMNDDINQDLPSDATPRKPSWKKWAAVSVTSVVLGVAAIGGIGAATSSGSSGAAASSQSGSGSATAETGDPGGFAGRPGGSGTITNISGSTLTIEDQSGASTKVLTSASTKVTTSASGSASDVKVGDTVMVIGTGSSTNIAATQVTDDGKVSADESVAGAPTGADGNGPPDGGNGAPNGQPPAGASNMAITRGVVASVGDGTFTVTGTDGTQATVTTSSATTVSIATSAHVSDLKVGDTIMAMGTQSDGTITATTITEGSFGGFPGANGGGAPSGGGSQ